MNRVTRTRPAEYRDILARNLFAMFSAMVVPAAVAMFLLGEWRGAVAVGGLAVVNTALGVSQDLHAKWTLDCRPSSPSRGRGSSATAVSR